MRDVIMDISPTAIETFHKTPHYESNFYDTLNEDEMDYDEIIEFLIDGRGVHSGSWTLRIHGGAETCVTKVAAEESIFGSSIEG
ncbi:hypothetical protein Gorai_021651 [Gossypium raimondii]|uniref:Uncharacterized protein n=1 Tax=Gossypium raimondii TaxID=29730 RepID=A0A7J8NRK1_GOSRA|nr:hypothetical protein [Gossypium raimondii]